MQHEVLAILAEAHDYASYLQKLEIARGLFANYEDRLANGEVDVRELVVSKRITREPRDYQKAGVTAIAAQQLFGSGVKLRPYNPRQSLAKDSNLALTAVRYKIDSAKIATVIRTELSRNTNGRGGNLKIAGK
jgi:DNA polymerase elongation subunit (family B)